MPTPLANLDSVTAAQNAGGVAIRVATESAVPAGYPFRLGVPFAPGVLADVDPLVVAGEGQVRLPTQATKLAEWADGSVRFALLDWVAAEEVAGDTRFELLSDGGSPDTPTDRSVRVQQDGNAVTVIANGRRWRFGARGKLWGESNQGATLALVGSVADAGEIAVGEVAVEVIHAGPLRAVVRASADLLVGGAESKLRVFAESHFVAGSSLRKATLTVRNHARAAHPGGVWELGDAGSTLINDLSVRITPVGGADRASCLLSGVDRKLAAPAGRLHLFQASSGGENWRSSNHVNRAGEVPLPFAGFRLTTDAADAPIAGQRATPVFCLHRGDEVVLGLAPERFWQNFPKAIRFEEEGASLGLFPHEANDPHELQGGEQKTHAFWLTDEPSDAPLLRLGDDPVELHTDPAHLASSQAVRFLAPLEAGEDSRYRALVECGVDGEQSFAAKRETIDQYGWRHFGDAYGDHEAAFHEGDTPLVSHWNNQYDLVFGLGVRYLRGGDRRWFQLMEEMAWHVLDIDIYHTDDDKSAYNHGLFWHTVHYVDAGKANHRSYPSGTCGGGPSAEHAYARGLQLYYYLTGEQAARDAVVELGDWVYGLEDGSKTPFRWLAGGPTGLSSSSGNPDYHGPGRGPGNASETLLTAYELTRDRKYLDRVEELMHRVVHPQDNHEALNLLDAETRWYYNLYLQALGRYLEIKHENGEHDEAFAYGRTTLLHYARWMADNEYPYLQKPEILEYPTETWSAQDMRKSEVFHFAARHAGGEERERFLERAEYFFNSSVSELSENPAASYCRPIALLLGSGFSAPAIRGAHPPSAADTAADAGAALLERPRFVPQKEKAKTRALALAACTLCLAAIIALGALLTR